MVMSRFLPLLVALMMSSGALFGSAVLAAAANDHTLPPPNSFDDINPCTGAVTTITETPLRSVFHDSEDANGGVHFPGTTVFKVETEDGFSGRETVWFGGNVNSDMDVEAFTFSV